MVASPEAARATRDALDLMRAAEAVHVVLVGPLPSFADHRPEPGADVATYLARHGVSATVHWLPKTRKDVSGVFLRAADLIVMDGFGHSRLRRRIFGGTTASMTKAPPVPVLIAHRAPAPVSVAITP